MQIVSADAFDSLSDVDVRCIAGVLMPTYAIKSIQRRPRAWVSTRIFPENLLDKTVHGYKASAAKDQLF